MRLPFTLDQFLGLFREYNEAIGIAPPILVMCAALVAGFAFSRYQWRHRAIGLALAALSLWTGVVYHWIFFTRINPIAWVFGGMFVAQAVVLAVLVRRDRFRFADRRGATSVLGLAVIAYALVGYPLLAASGGHAYPEGPSFGAPCPATIYFFGMMLLTVETAPVAAIVLPVLWAVIATSAALQLGMREDFGLTVSALFAAVAIARRSVQVTPVSRTRSARARTHTASSPHAGV